MTTEWPLVRLGDLVSQSVDRHLVEAGRLYPNVGIYGFGRGVFEKPPIDGGTFGAQHLYRLRAGQFIYSRLKAFEGAYGLVPDCADGAFVTNEFPCFKINTDLITPRFLFWYFRRPIVWKQLARYSTGVGARRERLHPAAFLRETIPLPPIRDQQRIVEAVDAIVQRAEAASRLREEIRSDCESLSQSTFLRSIQDARYFSLAEVAPIVRRPVTIQDEGEYPELGVRSFGKGTFHKPTLVGASLQWQKLFRVQVGDLLISNIKAWEGAIAVASPADHDRVGSHRYITCVPREGLATAEFLCFYLLTPEGLEQVQAASPGSADRNRTLAMKRLEQIRVPVPDIGRQQAFSALQRKIGAIRQAQTDNQPELDALLPAILDKAFRGEL